MLRARHDAEAQLAELRGQLRQAAAQLARSERSRTELAATAQALETAGRQALARPLPGAPAHELPTVQGPTIPGPLAVGDVVRVASLNQEGRVSAILPDGDSVEIQLGNFKLRTGKDDLEWLRRGSPADSAPAPSYASSTIWGTSQRATPSLQLDLRGFRAEQVVPELERYLNDAVMSGLPSVRIIHGKGTGVVRQVVRDFLTSSSLVDHFETGDAREGGDGATVAYLAG